MNDGWPDQRDGGTLFDRGLGVWSGVYLDNVERQIVARQALEPPIVHGDRDEAIAVSGRIRVPGFLAGIGLRIGKVELQLDGAVGGEIRRLPCYCEPSLG